MLAIRAALLAAVATIILPAIALAQSDSAGRDATVLALQASGDDGDLGGDGLRASHATVLSPADHALYRKAFDAADRGDWAGAKALAMQGQDPVARKLVLWRYMLSPDSHASFDEINGFLHDNPDWPLQSAMQARAEHAMPATLAPAAIIAWFGPRPPASAIGKVRLGEALLATGDKSKGSDMIRDAWVHGSFTGDEERTTIARDGALLTASDQHERLSRLIGRGDLGGARRQLNRVTAAEQRVAEVRIAMQSQPKIGLRMWEKLPENLRADPGLMLDRAKLLRAQGDTTVLPATLTKSPLKPLAALDPSRWWDQISLAARESMQSHDYQLAYRLVAEAKTLEGEALASAQFMAGWLALHFLHDGPTAIDHFKTLEDNVSRPISQARADYWLGRAYEAQGRSALAIRAYQHAATNPETYYGQLALARLDPEAKLKLSVSAADPAKVAAAYDKDEQTRAIHILADLDAERFLRLFAVHDVELHPDASRVAALAGDLVHLGYRDIALRAAKAASYLSIDLPTYLHPLIPLPAYRGPGTAPEPALVLALIRQETEFNSSAVSGAGARGLMQMMPATGRKIAELSGLPWTPAALTTDDTYNIQLGMSELSSHLAAWGGSYILAVAGYNAGDRNVKRWIETFGDPRTGAIDPIDWIELIPFAETRNYVQRVIENLEVYRSRLAGHPERLQILADLYRPNPAPQAKLLADATGEPLDPALPTARPEPTPSTAAQSSGTEQVAAIEPTPALTPQAPPARDGLATPAIVPTPRPPHKAATSTAPPHKLARSHDRQHHATTALKRVHHSVAARSDQPAHPHRSTE